MGLCEDDVTEAVVDPEVHEWGGGIGGGAIPGLCLGLRDDVKAGGQPGWLQEPRLHMYGLAVVAHEVAPVRIVEPDGWPVGDRGGDGRPPGQPYREPEAVACDRVGDSACDAHRGGLQERGCGGLDYAWARERLSPRMVARSVYRRRS